VRPQFMKFTAFDWGKIAWLPAGLPSVGCAAKDIYDNWYKHAYGPNATYYSLPGRCYQRPFYSKDHETFAMTHGPLAEVELRCAHTIEDAEERETVMSCLKEKEAPPTFARQRSLSNTTRRRADETDFHTCDGTDGTQYVLCKDDQCLREVKGGECDAPDGSHTCTWRADLIGFVTLDDLEGRSDHGLNRRSLESSCFWDGKDDPVRCKERVQRLDQLFRMKYPEVSLHSAVMLLGPAMFAIPFCF
jgi:hypothetical protein